MKNLDKLISSLAKSYCPSSFGLEDKKRAIFGHKEREECIYGISEKKTLNKCIECFELAIITDKSDLYIKGYNDAIEQIMETLGGQKNEVPKLQCELKNSR